MKFFDYFTLFILALTVANIFTVKSLRIKSASKRSDFEILVPMRNEAHNVVELISNLLQHGGKVLVLNDNSTDDTSKKLGAFKNDINIIEGKPLPGEWLGKNFACHQLAINSLSDYLVFLDADVRLEIGAVSEAIDYLEFKGWDFISPYPKQVTSGFLQFVLQPLLQWSWFATIPFFYAYYSPKKSMAVANGQFFIIKRQAYLNAGGHKKIKGEVFDDIELAKSIISVGGKGGPVDGSQIAKCHMYKRDRELISGYGKSLWRAFHLNIASLFLALFIFLNLAPYLTLSIGIIFLTLSRVLVGLKVRSNIFSAFFHPFAILGLTALVVYSNYLHATNKLIWKDRTLS